MSIKRITVLFVIIAVLSMAVYVVAEEVLTNETVVKMVKAGLEDSIIINKVKNSKNNFDLSTDAIIELKKQGVGGKVIEAMMGGWETVSPTKADSKAIGDFFLLQNGKLIEIEEHTGYQKVSMGAKAFLTGGFATDAYYIIDGSKASFRIPASQENLVFISKIKIDPLGIQGGDLFKLGKERKRRFIIMSVSITAGNAGNTKPKYKTQYEVKKNSDGTYTITTKGPLPAGEYAFAFGSSQNSGVRFFDFGIDGETNETQKSDAVSKQE